MRPHQSRQSCRVRSGRPRRSARWGGALCAIFLVPIAAVSVVSPAGAATTANVLRVKAGEYVYQLHGSPKPGWVTLEFDNAGTEMHMMALLALQQGVTTAQLKQAVVSNDDSATGQLIDTSVGDQGTIDGAPTVIGPHQRTTSTVQLPAGHYGLLCFVPAAGDGAPHAAHGMIKTFDVKGKAAKATRPSTQAEVTLSDSGIDFPLTNPGHHLALRVANAGTAPHSFALVKVADGQTLDGVKAYFDAFFSGSAPAGDPPGVIVGGVAAIAPGARAYLDQDLTPGHYGYVSTEGDAPADDYARGLKGEFTVK